MTGKDRYPGGGGNMPGGEGDRRVRRRGSLDGGSDEAAPMTTGQPAPAAAVDGGELAMTSKEAPPDAKVWGLRVSERHYDIARQMMAVLGTRYRLEQRQVGELLVQFLVDRRFDLDTFVASQAGPAIDLDFFARPGPEAPPR